MNNTDGFWLVIIMVIATLIIFVTLVRGGDGTHWHDYDDIEHRKEGMETLKHMYEDTHYDEGNDHDEQPIPGVQQGVESPDL